jgi:multidrug resistance efflux pump
MPYVIEALGEVGRTSLVTAKLLRDTGIVIGAAIIALALAASTLRRRTGALTRSTRLALLVIPLVALIVSGALAASYFLEAGRYVCTDNAQIDGDKIPVTAPVGGTLVGWHATQGSALRKDQTIGRIQIQGGFLQPQRVIQAPADGTVVVDNGVEGTFVTVGTQLAVAYDLSKIFVIARVDETAIGDVRLGRQVDIAVDAYPNITLTGYVWEIQGGTAGLFSQFRQDNTTGNFQETTQVIPVQIAITDQKNLTLLPGMNATVKIHKN